MIYCPPACICELITEFKKEGKQNQPGSIYRQGNNKLTDLAREQKSKKPDWNDKL